MINSYFPTFSTGFALSSKEAKYPHLWNGLVGAWCPSLGKQGDILRNLSLYNHNAVLTGMDASTDYIPDIRGFALNYDGTNDYLDIGHIEEIDDATKDLTFIFRTRTTASGNNALFTYDTNDSLSPTSDIYVFAPAGLNIGGVGDGSQHATGVSINDGVWHWIAIRLKGTELSVFKDGAKVYSLVVTHSRANYGVSHNFRIADNSNVLHYPGDIGDFFVYNRGLEDSEIVDIQVGQTPLVPHFFSLGKKIIVGAVVDPLDLTLSIESPTIQIDSTITPSVLEILSNIETPLVGEILTVTPDSLTISSSIESPTIQSDVDFSPDILTITSNIESPIFPVQGSLIAKIIHVNPLIAVTDTNPVQILKIDITDPNNLDYTSVTIPNISNTKDVCVDYSGDYVYVTGNSGKVVKVKIADLADQTTINLSDTDDILTIEHNTNFGITYAGTDNEVGELYTIDEKSTFKIDSDFTCLAPHTFKLDSNFNIVSAFKMDSAFTALSYNYFKMNSDFKCLTKQEVPVFPDPPPDPDPPVSPTPITPVDTIEPIKLEDYQVFVNSVELENTDLILNSISITHSVGQESRASFQLSRKHDQLNTTLKGVSSEITNQNEVIIKCKGQIIFPHNGEGTGKISELDCQYQNDREYVIVNALSEEATNKFDSITMSLPGLNNRLSLYDILIQNPKINNPYIDPENEENPKKYKGIKVDLGTEIEQHISNWHFSDTGVRGIFGEAHRPGIYASAIINGTFIPWQNWTYFWGAGVYKIGKTELGDTVGHEFMYIGTSLAPVSEDLWELINASHFRQRIYDDTETGKIYISASPGYTETISTRIGTEKVITSYYPLRYAIRGIYKYKTYYYIGETPFNEVSPRNGKLITHPKYVDEPSLLVSTMDASYDFTKYAKRVADLEYELLKNINGDILPDTSCSFNLTIDAYLYYNISLLTRINVDNTTQSNIYKNSNGFPVSAKSITITSSDRRVNIEADNTKSSKELEVINAQFPDEEDDEYNEPEKRKAIYGKSDMRTLKEVK